MLNCQISCTWKKVFRKMTLKFFWEWVKFYLVSPFRFSKTYSVKPSLKNTLGLLVFEKLFLKIHFFIWLILLKLLNLHLWQAANCPLNTAQCTPMFRTKFYTSHKNYPSSAMPAMNIFSAVQCNALKHSTVQYSAVKVNEVHCSALKCTAERCSSVHFGAVQCSTCWDSPRRTIFISTLALLVEYGNSEVIYSYEKLNTKQGRAVQHYFLCL